MKNPKLFCLIALLATFLSACGGGPNVQTPPSVTPEALEEVTLQAALPTGSSPSDPSGIAAGQPAGTLPLVFDQTRTEANPITDAQQIIEILEDLEGIERSQPFPPGWYLRSINGMFNPDKSENFYAIYHVIDEDLNCDLAMNFLHSPDGNLMSMMFRNYGTPIWSNPFRGPIARMEGDTSYVCNLANPNLYMLYIFSDYSETFSNTVARWREPGVEHWGNYSYSAWFEGEKDQPVFVLQENSDNMRAAYTSDPDTKELTAMRSEIEKRTYSLDTGYLLSSQTTITLANKKIKRIHESIQMEYYREMNDLPFVVLDYLEEVLLLYDDLQTP